MLQGVSDPRVGMSDPPRLVVTKEDSGSEITLAFEQLSDGYRGVLALAADIARHLAGGAAGESTNALHRTGRSSLTRMRANPERSTRTGCCER